MRLVDCGENRRCRGEVGVRTRLWENAEERRRGQQTVGRRTASEVFESVWPKVEGGPTRGHVPPDVEVCRIDQALPRRRFRGELICGEAGTGRVVGVGPARRDDSVHRSTCPPVQRGTQRRPFGGVRVRFRSAAVAATSLQIKLNFNTQFRHSMNHKRPTVLNESVSSGSLTPGCCEAPAPPLGPLGAALSHFWFPRICCESRELVQGR